MPIDPYWLKDKTAPYATTLRLIHTYRHPEADEDAYDDLKLRARTADPSDNEIIVFKTELRRLLSGDLDQLPNGALGTAAAYDEPSDKEFLRRLWRDLYGDESVTPTDTPQSG